MCFSFRRGVLLRLRRRGGGWGFFVGRGGGIALRGCLLGEGRGGGEEGREGWRGKKGGYWDGMWWGLGCGERMFFFLSLFPTTRGLLDI